MASLDTTTIQPTTVDFPAQLVGKRVLLATESLGPINGVSRTTQSLITYLRANGVNVATCAPYYQGQPIHGPEPTTERRPIVNKGWVRSIEAKSSSLGSRAIGGAWQWHFDRGEQSQHQKQTQPLLSPSSVQSSGDGAISRSKAIHTKAIAKRKQANPKLNRENPEFRLQGYPLPYNPDLTVAYPFRLGVVYQKTFRPDVVYLASPASVGFQFLIQLGQLKNPPPTLLNFQTDLSAYASILFAPPIDRYGVFLLQLVQGYLFRLAAVRTIFYPSAYVRKYMEAVGAPPEKMIQLGRGVDTELFCPERRDESYRQQIAPDGEIIFCCVSRLAPEKGFDFLAQTARRLKSDGLAFKLLIVGGNKNPAVESEVRSYFHDLRDRVVFTGFLRGTSLARAYACADVFLHCSITETYGLDVLESMASGVPVVARDEGGPSETVKHGESGYLVSPLDLDTFVKYAASLATDAALRSNMATSARQQALETTWDKINHQVALQLAAALADRPVESDMEIKQRGFYDTGMSMLRVYFAVAIVWVFWFIAVLPLLACGFVHGLFK